MASLEPVVRIRPAVAADAAAFAELALRNREFWRSGEPTRPQEYYTANFQRRRLEDLTSGSPSGFMREYLIEADERLAGSIGLGFIIRGPFQSATVSYGVDESMRGRGIATAALRQLISIAFGELNLHRLQAGTLVDNEASKRVLAHCGFVHYGRAPDYLKIDGRWQANDLFQLINDEHRPDDMTPAISGWG